MADLVLATFPSCADCQGPGEGQREHTGGPADERRRGEGGRTVSATRAPRCSLRRRAHPEGGGRHAWFGGPGPRKAARGARPRRGRPRCRRSGGAERGEGRGRGRHHRRTALRRGLRGPRENLASPRSPSCRIRRQTNAKVRWTRAPGPVRAGRRARLRRGRRRTIGSCS